MIRKLGRLLEPMTLSAWWVKRVSPLAGPYWFYRGARMVGSRRSALKATFLEVIGK